MTECFGSDWMMDLPQTDSNEALYEMSNIMQIKSTKGIHCDQVKLLVYGKSGVGKTSFLGTGDNGSTLIVSAEKGLLSLAEKNIDVIEVDCFETARQAYAFVMSDQAQKYKTICIDSLTELSDMLVSTLEKQPEYKDPKNTLKLWGEYNKRMTSFIKAFRGVPKNVVFTALEEEVNDGGTLIRKPFIKGSATQKLLESYFDELFYLYVDAATNQRQLLTQPTTYISAKDRSGKLLDTEEPDLASIISKIKQSPTITH
jgi:phage nucleotide-binding protein